MKGLLGALVLLSLGMRPVLADNPADLAAATIVVYNRNAPDSAGLARFYAKARNIHDDHVVGLECSTDEEISREEYDQTIAQPLRKIFAEHNWWRLHDEGDEPPVVQANRIHFVALIRGMPLKIRATAAYQGDHVQNNPLGGENKASVDSELAVLGLFSRQISGPMNNPYFQSFRPIAELAGPPLLLVCRLDAPTAAIVRRMITDAIETEKSGLWGRAYVDGANNKSPGMADGDLWLKSVVSDLRRVGVPVVYDREPALFPAGFPMNDCALYYGWYSGEVTGPFTDPNFSFERGAIAVHIHSFSASTLRSATANWVGPLLSKGAAASLGNVYEPYLQLTAHLDIFNDRLIHGFTFAESAYMAARAVSWMNVAVGDPLYRPYANWLQIDTSRENGKKSDWRMYHDFAVTNAESKPADYLTKARAAASRAKNGPMMEDLGLIDMESGRFTSAVALLRQARSFYSQPEDILRSVLEQANALIKSGDRKGALSLVREVAQLVPDAPATVLLKKIEQQLNPPPPTPQPSL
ncbi:MAG: TIGR03790 family protein [Chthoniobacterales bacterium]